MKKEYIEKRGFIRQSKKGYFDGYINILANEIYLNQKYHKEQNNSLRIILNDCLNKAWSLNSKEKENLLKKALKKAKKML